MKKSMNKALAASILLLVAAFTGCKSKEPSADELLRLNQMKEILDTQKFTFVATVAVPTDMSADFSSFNLTSRYVLKVSKDSVYADLPYMGKTYIGIPGKGADGINFVSKDYRYEVKIKNRQALTVTITPQDLHFVKYATLNVLTNGTASLSVQETSRPPMSFEGILER
jgi:hypothetical protein